MTLQVSNRVVPYLCVVAWVCAVLAPGVVAEENMTEEQDSAVNALTKGGFEVSLRYRYEHVSDDEPSVAAKDARASTLRTTLSYRSGTFASWSLFGEFENVSDVGLGQKHDNAGAGSLFNGVSDRPGIADPALTEINQAYLRYTGWPRATVTIGRQEIALGTQRFVGPVGWRQNHQSFDAVRIGVDASKRVKVDYSLLGRVQRIFGDDKPLSGHLLDIAIKASPSGRLTPYVYALDYDRSGDAGLSTTTYGIRWQNTWDPDGRWSVPYQVEVARQYDTGDNPGQVDAEYRMIEVGGKRGALWFKAGYELLGGEVGDGSFATPLATGHKFNGWADKFLATPANGLQDVYVAVGGTHAAFTGQIVYHDFSSDSLGVDYGREFDLQVSYTAPWKQLFAIKAASYDADLWAFDTLKVWFWTAYSWGG